jgi:acyl-CoA reductase-like NAD-dependent aldehyde dehydrogenase
MSTERIIVQRSIVDPFRTAFAEAMARMYGKSHPAPVLIRTDLVTKNKSLVSNALSQGASAFLGNPDGEEASANRMRPIVLENVTPEMDIYDTESFGPTVSLYVVSSDDEAIQLANDTEYGLSAAVYTENLGRGLRIAKQLESGYANNQPILSPSLLSPLPQPCPSIAWVLAVLYSFFFFFSLVTCP